MSELFRDKKLYRNVSNQAKVENASAYLQGKVVALYFSAHWCPPCRSFTPLLKDFYEELNPDSFEIIFVSFDHNESGMNSYLTEFHGQWCYIPFGDPMIKELTAKYEISGIPALVIINANGDAVVKNVRTFIMNGSKSPTALLAEWKNACGI